MITETDKTLKNRLEKNKWFVYCSVVIGVIIIVSLSRDITRPFNGLHSWGQAHDAWVAKSHVKYGLGYTKGFDTFAVGNPPAAQPTRYLDHPLLFTHCNSIAMLLFGVNEWALRITNIIATVLSLFIFLRILRGLTDELTALLAGLFFCMFPLISYFGVNQWLYPLVLTAIWCYLVLIKGLRNGPEPGKIHKIMLAGCLFISLQMSWEAFFFAMAIGVHYVFRCIKRKHMPDKSLLIILIAAPFLSLALNFTLLAAGHNWDFQRIFALAKIRATSGEKPGLNWSEWSGFFWKHAKTNFGLPVLIVSVVYLTIGQLLLQLRNSGNNQNANSCSAKVPQFWLFLMPATFQLLILKGTLAPHQYWERPLVLILAIVCACSVTMVYDLVSSLNRKAALAASVLLAGIMFIWCIKGTNHYYRIVWQQPAKIDMFKSLNEKIPSDKALLSFEGHTVDQFPGIKAASYRPEIAWYLDRDIVVARSVEEINAKKQTGKFQYYLIPQAPQLGPLVNLLAQKYEYEFIPGKQAIMDKNNAFLEAGMYPYLIFDLYSKKGL